MLTHLMNKPCQIIRNTPSPDEEDRNEYGWADPKPTVINTVCELQSLQERERAEKADANELPRSTWRLFLRPEDDIDSDDVLIVDGHRYEIDGHPWVVRDPWNQVDSHIQATLIRVGEEQGS